MMEMKIQLMGDAPAGPETGKRIAGEPIAVYGNSETIKG